METSRPNQVTYFTVGIIHTYEALPISIRNFLSDAIVTGTDKSRTVIGLEDITPALKPRSNAGIVAAMEEVFDKCLPLPDIKPVRSGRRRTDPIHYIKEPSYESYSRGDADKE